MFYQRMLFINETLYSYMAKETVVSSDVVFNSASEITCGFHAGAQDPVGVPWAEEHS